MRYRIIHHLSSASSHGSASEITHPYVFPYLQNKWSAADDGELSLFLGHEKNLFLLWVPHLSLSNIWLLVKTFLCLSWANIKNYITALLTTSVCVSKELYIQGGLVHIWTENLTQWWAVMCPSFCPWRLYLTSRMDLITCANKWLGHPPLAVLLWRTAQGLTARKTPLGTLIQLELNAVKHETFFRPCCVGKRPKWLLLSWVSFDILKLAATFTFSFLFFVLVCRWHKIELRHCSRPGCTKPTTGGREKVCSPFFGQNCFFLLNLRWVCWWKRSLSFAVLFVDRLSLQLPINRPQTAAPFWTRGLYPLTQSGPGVLTFNIVVFKCTFLVCLSIADVSQWRLDVQALI